MGKWSVDERYPWSKVASFDGDLSTEGEEEVMVPKIGRPPLPTPPELPFEGPVPVSERVSVFVRVRPLIAEEKEAGDQPLQGMASSSSAPSDDSAVAVETEQGAVGGFAGVLGPEADNSLVFERAFKAKLETVLGGGTASLLCYGYTGSGKTHTVLGSDSEEGLYYKAAGELLSRLETEHPEKKLFLVATACEVYADNVYDLLGTEKVACSLKTDSDGNLAIRVIEAKDIGELLEEFKGLTEGEHATMVTQNVGLRHVKVRSLEDLKAFSSMVLQQRVVGSSTEHQASSRSHAIIRMEVMDEEVCSALEAAEEARALLPALLSAFDNHQTSCFNELLDLASSNQEDGTVGLKQLPGGQQEWDKVREGLVLKKDELTRVSGPIFQRVDQAYRRLEEVHGREGIGGALQLVDLAGADFDDRDLASTSATTSTNSTSAQQRKESIDINKSLLALKECFRSVGTKGSKAPRACFRGSKLTRLLEDSIMPAESSMRRGRACSSVMVLNVSPVARISKRTMNVLRYGQIFTSGKVSSGTNAGRVPLRRRLPPPDAQKQGDSGQK